MAIRSGRFVGDATGNGINIISGHEGTYRIFNAGANPFAVYEGANPLVAAVPVDCSVDIRPSGVISIRSANPVDGIYDFLAEHASVRSGRFKVNATLEIVGAAKDGNFYRVMNSGHTEFAVVKLKNATAIPVVDLQPKMTIDVELRGERLAIVPTGVGEGIYYHLDQVSPVKSGRFKLDPNIPATTPANPSVAHPIVDTASQSKVESYYRIFNSGAFPFSVTGLGSPVSLRPGLSFDFKIEKTNTVIRVVGANATDPIEGIYEFVGEHD